MSTKDRFSRTFEEFLRLINLIKELKKKRDENIDLAHEIAKQLVLALYKSVGDIEVHVNYEKGMDIEIRFSPAKKLGFLRNTYHLKHIFLLLNPNEFRISDEGSNFLIRITTKEEKKNNFENLMLLILNFDVVNKILRLISTYADKLVTEERYKLEKLREKIGELLLFTSEGEKYEKTY